MGVLKGLITAKNVLGATNALVKLLGLDNDFRKVSTVLT